MDFVDVFRRYTRYCTILMLSVSHCFAAEYDLPAFKSLEWEDVSIQAIRSGQLIFVDLSASWCLPCQWMEEHTFQDPTLIKLLSEQFTSVKYDIQSIDGVSLKEKYHVRTLPTMLILSPSGEELMRFQESYSAHALSHELKKLLKRYKYEAQPYYKISRSPLRKSNDEGKQVVAKSQDEVATSATVKSHAYWLQLGYFSNIENANRLKEKVKDLNLTIIPVEKENESHYLVCSATSYDYEQAKDQGRKWQDRYNIAVTLRKQP